MAIPNQAKYRFNEEPRISANQLAEYALASPTRRQSILRNAKYPPTFLVIRYSEAKKAICQFLSDDARKIAGLLTAENELLQADGFGTAFAQNDAALSAEAIKAFRKIYASNKLPPTATFTLGQQSLPKLPINGVDVSIRLDLVARNEGKGTVGGVLIQTSKAVASKGWRRDHSKVVSSLVWMLADKHLAALGKVDRKLCMSIDVFGDDIMFAPTSYKRLLNDVTASCGEISALWGTISPPSDYDGPQ